MTLVELRKMKSQAFKTTTKAANQKMGETF